MRVWRVCVLIGAALVLSACASDPKVDGAVSAPALANAPAAPAAPAVPANATAAAPAETADEDAKLEAAFVREAASYKKVSRDGQEFYCKKERPLGSRLPVEYCLTEAQLRAQVIKSQETRDRMTLPGAGPCGQGSMSCK